MRHIIRASPILYTLLFCLVIGSIGCERNQQLVGDNDKPLLLNSRQGDIVNPFRARLLASFYADHIVQIQDSAFYP